MTKLAAEILSVLRIGTQVLFIKFLHDAGHFAKYFLVSLVVLLIEYSFSAYDCYIITVSVDIKCLVLFPYTAIDKYPRSACYCSLIGFALSPLNRWNN